MRALAIDREIISELRVRTSWRGDTKRVARDFGISASHLYGILNGNARITGDVRKRLLARFREEELALADKIEAELNAPSTLKECE